MRRVVVGALLVDDLVVPSRVLAARRTRPPALAGQWEFPGGKVEPGETPVEAVRREVLEELGVTTTVGAELAARPGPGWPISDDLVLRLFFAHATGSPSPRDHSHDELRWLDRDSLWSVPWLVSDREALIPLAARLGQPGR